MAVVIVVNLMTMTHDALVGQGEEDFLLSLPGAAGGWKRVQMSAVTDLASPLPNNTFLFSNPAPSTSAYKSGKKNC